MSSVARHPSDGGEETHMPGGSTNERFTILSGDSSLTFYATASTQSAYGKTKELRGFIEASFGTDGTFLTKPAPQMHIEFEVESLRTGNELQDREMCKLIDSKRFPKVAGDLQRYNGGTLRGRYSGSGKITLAGLSREYEGEFSLERENGRAVLDGELQIDVRDFGLKPVKLLVLGVAPLVRVRLHVVAERLG
jgi:hypothetical protein